MRATTLFVVALAVLRAPVLAGNLSQTDAAWRDPSCLPTVAELEDPQSWLKRTREPVSA
jgi:uncharacterized protein (DUF2342 family)